MSHKLELGVAHVIAALHVVVVQVVSLWRTMEDNGRQWRTVDSGEKTVAETVADTPRDTLLSET